MFTLFVQVVKAPGLADGFIVRESAAGWLALTLLAVGAVAPAIASGPAYVGDGIDVFGTFWFYGWVSHCLESGANPAFTDWMFHPYGKDIFAHTGGNLVDAVASIPFQWVFGTPGFQPPFIAAILLSNAWAFRRLMRGQGVDGWACWGATALWMLNPFVVFELLTGRITQAFLVFLPLAIHHFLHMSRGRPRDAVLAGLFTAAQAWTYWFMGLFMATAFAGIALAQWRSGHRTLRFWCSRWALAAAACAALVLPAVWNMAAAVGAGDVPGIGAAAGWAGWVDALTGGKIPHLHGLMLNETNGVHIIGYVPWAVLCLAAVLHPRTRGLWGLMLAVSVAFSIGPVFTYGGIGDVPMPHYLFGLHMIPFVERLWFPYRWVVVAMLAASVAAGLLLVQLPKRWSGAAAVAAVALGILPQIREGVLPLTAKPWAMSALYTEMAEREGGLLELPLMVPRESLMYQPIHRQVLFGGMGENAPVFWPPAFKHKMGNHFVRFLRAAVRTQSTVPTFQPADLEDVQADGARWIVLDRHALMGTVSKMGWYRVSEQSRKGAAARTVSRISAAIGPPVAVDGALVVWDLQNGPAFDEPFTPTSESLDGLGWTQMDWVSYEATLDARLRKEGGIE